MKKNHKERKVPMRRCAVCMESQPKQQLIRIVYHDGILEADAQGKKNGRGVYLCRKEACIEACEKKHALQRSLRCELDKDAVQKALQEVRDLISEDAEGKHDTEN